jgi:hypothetical protein
MDEDEALGRFGLHPSGVDVDEVRDLLRAAILHERQAQGGGDTELMKLFCVQLFNVGDLDDVLLIWSAKTASWDADCSIDVQLLCGAGLDATIVHLAQRPEPQASTAHQRLLDCRAVGDFHEFTVEQRTAWCATYYAPDNGAIGG